MRSSEDPRPAMRAVALSIASVVLFPAYAAMPGSPFQPAVLPPGSTPAGPFVWLARVLRFDHLSGAPLIGVGVILTVFAMASFLLLLREAWRGNVSLRTVLILAVAYHVVVLLMPVLFSRDVYSYAYYGRIVGVYHGNPYVQTPLAFSKDPLWHLLGPKWVNTPAVYGPLFTSIAGVFARLFTSPSGAVDAYRVLAIVASLATVFVTAWTAREIWPSRAAFAVVAFGVDPVILFHSVASAHNDLLVALSVISGLAFLVRGRELGAVASLTVGMLIKATGALPLILLILYCVARRPPAERRRAWLTHVGLALGLVLLFAMPYLQLHDPTLGMLELARHEGWLAPSLFFQRLFEHIYLRPLGFAVRVAFALAIVAGMVGLGREVWRRNRELSPRGNGAAWGWALMLLLLLGPVLLAWYVVWIMPLVWLLPRAPRTALLTTAVALALAQWVTEVDNFPTAFSASVLIGRWVISPVIILLLAWMLVDLRRRFREGLPLECEEEGVASAAGER